VFIIGDVIYWANQGQVLSSNAAMPPGVYDTVASGSADASKVTALTIHGTTAYFADDTGMVLKAPLMTNSMTTKLARGQLDMTTHAGVSSIAASDTMVYWANPACEIMSLPAN
jgi:hypothetical protein